MSMYIENIGKKVSKCNVDGTPKDKQKPFKSGRHINTIKGICDHPYLPGEKAYTFEEDDSYVECRRCKILEKTQI